MPELPEVESVRRSLEPHLLNIPITHIELLRPDFLSPQNAPLKNLHRQKITNTHRHGKKMFFVANDGQTLVLHLGMSGKVRSTPAAAPPIKHTHVILHLANHTEIRLIDPRRFGGLAYYPTEQRAHDRELANLGPDALTLTTAHLAHWKKSPGKLKARLLGQHDVAGLGNIYVDEALFRSQLHPLQLVKRLTPQQIATLVKNIHLVLQNSLRAQGTTLRDYRNVADQPGTFARQLLCYGHSGQNCPTCQTPFKTATIATRTTVFCPTCQKRH